MTTTSDIWIDKKISDYCILEELGKGTYGSLYLGQHQSNHDYVAIKILSKRGLNHGQLAIQQLEVDLQQKLAHKNILSLQHVIDQKDYLCMIMELCDGGDLFEYVVQQQLDTNEIKHIFSQIVDALEYMHTNHIYHRDIKLENILLTTIDNDPLTCKVADFGLATTQSHSLEFGCGSTTYLAPEHFGSEESEDNVEDVPYSTAASDIWSLGILLIALLYGENPWAEATSADDAFIQYQQDPNYLKYLFPALSSSCLSLLQAMLHVDPLQRCTISQVKEHLFTMNNLFAINIPQPIKSSYDSAIFSDTCSVNEEQMEIDEEQDVHMLEEEDDLFIHSQEKQSWWL